MSISNEQIQAIRRRKSILTPREYDLGEAQEDIESLLTALAERDAEIERLKQELPLCRGAFVECEKDCDRLRATIDELRKDAARDASARDVFLAEMKGLRSRLYAAELRLSYYIEQDRAATDRLSEVKP